MIYKDENNKIVPPELAEYYKFVDYEGEDVVRLQSPDDAFLRQLRAVHCFPVINRGKLWYDNLTEEQHQELDKWYEDWLNVTETKVIPDKPSWLK